MAIDRAINPGKSSPNINANREFLRLQKAQSNSFAESRSNAVVGGISNRTSSSPPRVGNNKMLQKGGSFASSPYLKTTNLPTMKDLDEANISLSSKGSSNITTGVHSWIYMNVNLYTYVYQLILVYTVSHIGMLYMLLQ